MTESTRTVVTNSSQKVERLVCNGCEQPFPVTLIHNGLCVACTQLKAEVTNPQPEEIYSKLDTEIRDRAEMRESLAISRAERRRNANKPAPTPSETEQKELVLQELARRELCKEHLLPFVKRFNPDYDAGWVHKDICEHLEWFSAEVEAQRSPRLIICLPPRSGKSTLASVAFPAWYLGRNPSHEVISCSYSGSLSMSFSRKVRGVLRDPMYQNVFDTQLEPDSQSAEAWSTTANGSFVSSGVGGAITGKGAHCVSAYSQITTRRGNICAAYVKVGDEVLGYDHRTGQDTWTRVFAVSAGRRTAFISVAGARVTPDHLVWTENRGYIPASGFDSVVDTLRVQSLPQGVRPQAEGAPSFGQKARHVALRAAHFLLARVCAWGVPYRGSNHVRVRGSESTLCEQLPEVLLGEPGRGPCGAGVRKLRGVVSEATWRVREVETAPRGACAGVLPAELLHGTPAEEQTHYSPERRSVRALRHAKVWVEKAEVLFARLLCRVSQSAVERGWVFWLSRQLAYEKARDSQSGSAVSPMPSPKRARGTPHRPQPGQQRQNEPDHALSPVPHAVSSSHGVCAADLHDRVSAYGERVVDLQTGTGNFYCGGILLHNCLLIDDPLKNRMESESETTREMIWDWYTSTAYTRLAPGGGLLLIQTRWHDDDLAGRLLTRAVSGDGDQWKVISYQAIAEQDEPFRKRGQALHPTRYSIEALERIKRAIGTRDWSALYQQNPVADEGDMFRKNMIKYYEQKDLPPWDELHFYTCWDMAVATNEMNDFTVGITIGIDTEDNIYVIDVQRGRWNSLESVDKVLLIYKTYRSTITGMEAGQIELAIGPLLLKTAREQGLSGFTYHPMRTGRKDKVARARSIQGRMLQGKVFFRKHDDAQLNTIAELLRFPNGVHDDQVDAMAHVGLLLDELVAPRVKVTTKPVKSWKDKLHQYTSRGSRHRSHMSA